MAPVVAARVLLHAWLTATDCDVTCLDAVCRRIEHSVDRPGPSPPPGGGGQAIYRHRPVAESTPTLCVAC